MGACGHDQRSSEDAPARVDHGSEEDLDEDPISADDDQSDDDGADADGADADADDADGAEPDEVKYGRENDGQLCLNQDTLAPDPPRCGMLPLQEIEPLRFSGEVGCLYDVSEISEIGCEATVTGNRIDVESWMWLDPNFDSGPKKTLCQEVFAECESPPLPAGTYEIHYGKSVVEVEVGGTTTTLCLGGPEFSCCETQADCGVHQECAENECKDIPCAPGTCPEGSYCRLVVSSRARCAPCECPEGEICSSYPSCED